MSYLDYSGYLARGGTMTSTAFAKAEKQAERVMDSVTLERLRGGVPAEFSVDVADAMMVLVDSVDQILESYKAMAGGTQVTSFSNGVDSFSFGAGRQGRNEALEVARERAAAMLPIELTSVCALYNGAFGGTDGD